MRPQIEQAIVVFGSGDGAENQTKAASSLVTQKTPDCHRKFSNPLSVPC